MATIEQQRALARARARVRVQQEARARAEAPPADPAALLPVNREQATQIARERIAARSAPAAAPPPSRRSQGAPIANEIEGALANVNRAIPFAQDVSAIGSGVAEAASPAFSAFIGSRDASLPRIGQAFSRGYNRQLSQGREASADFMERRPNAANLAQGVGFVPPVIAALASGGASAVPQSVARVSTQAPGMFGRMGQGAAIGALTGEVYGAGTGDAPGEGLEQRLGEGNSQALFAAGLGAVAPPVIGLGAFAARGAGNLLRPAWQSIEGALPRAPRSSVGSMGGNVFQGPPPRPRQPPPQRPQIPGSVVGTVDRLRDRNEMSIDDFERQFNAARANPQGQVLADLFDEAGVLTGRSIAQSPGRSGVLSRGVRRERFRKAPGQIMSELQRLLGVGESRAAAMTRLEGDYNRLSAGAYQPMWAAPVTPRQVALAEERIAPMFNEPEVGDILRWAQGEARRQFNLDLSEGLVRGTFESNLPRTLHYMKMQLGNRGAFERSTLAGSSGQRIGSLRRLYRRFADLLDPPGNAPGNAIIPGYRAVTSEAADYHTLKDALDAGAEWTSMSGAEVSVARQSMGARELEHARIGLADEIRHTTRGGTNRNINVAARLDDPELQEAVAAAFDTPAQAAEFLSLINGTGQRGAPGLYQLLDNASRWGGGSSSWANATHGADEAVNALAEVGGHAATGNLSGVAHKAFQGGLNRLSLGAIERANNERGAALFRRVDGADAQGFTTELVRLLRARQASTRAQTTVSRASGAAAGAVQGRKRTRP